MARDGFVSFGSQGRGRVSVIALLGEQLGSRSPMSHRLGSGCTREQGRAGSGQDGGCGGWRVSCLHLVGNSMRKKSF